MTVFAQCGSRKGGVSGAIVADALRAGHIGGAILSPANEEPADLDALIAACKAARNGAEVMIDPQLYVSVMTGARQTHLGSHGWYPAKALKPASFTLRETQRIVRAALDWQYQRHVTTVIAPSIPITALDRDPYAQIAYMMAEEACEHHVDTKRPEPLLISLIVREDALQRTESVREFVDRLRGLEPAPAGVYLIVERLNQGYTPVFEERALANLLWCCHVLGNLDGLRVILGYTDMVGVLGQAAGAQASACGWHQKLRYFQRQNWMPSTGGGRARLRYTSAPLFDSLLVTPEVTSIQAVGLYPQARSGTPFDATVPEEGAWTPTTSTQHHWASIGRALAPITAAASPADRLEAIERLLVKGLALGLAIEKKGIPFENRRPAGHLESWRHALRIHRDAIKL